MYLFAHCIRLAVIAIFVTASPLAFTQDQPARSVQILTTFDYPGGSTTIAHGINQHGDVTGEFVGSNGIQAFVRNRNGNFSAPITHPDDMDGETFGIDINRSTLLGYYYDLTNFVFHSFGLTGGTFTSLDIPGAVSTAAIGLNSGGNYCGQVDYGSGVFEGFVITGGQVTTFVPQGATFTAATALNDLDLVAGVYQAGTTSNHGFTRDATGSFTYPVDYPGATSTTLRGINSHGWIVGSYNRADLVVHGFALFPPNTFISYDFPGSIFTTLEAVNDRGQICGQYKDVDGQRHAFIGRIR